MSSPKTKSMARAATAAAIATLGAALSGCAGAGLYLDHRDTIAYGTGASLAANQITQMVDPWPAHSGNPNIGFNGQRMQAAMERYRTNKVTGVQDSLAPSAASSGQAQNVTQITVGGSGGAPTT